MDQLPPEILSEIFRLACSDYGFTGRSLSCVSRYIRAASRRYKFQSISLIGVDEILAFSRAQDVTNHGGGVVRNLFIADYDPRHITAPMQNGEEDPIIALQLLELSRAEYRIQIRKRADERRIRETVAWEAALLSILRAEGRGLHTLTIFSSLQRTWPLLPTYLPALVELSVYGHLSLHLDTNPLPPIPSLRRLHLTLYPRFPSTIYTHIAHLAPMLTHLRFSSIVDEFVLPLHLAFALGISEPPEGARGRAELWRLPRTIERVIIQLGQWSVWAKGLVFRDLERLAREDARIVLLKERGAWLMRETEQHWLERNQGREGCWRC